MDNIELKQFNAEKSETEIVNPQEYVDDYINYIKERLKQAGFEIEIKKVSVGDSINVVIDFGRNNEHLGRIINGFRQDSVGLDAIGSKGGSGILEPLYAADAEFFISKKIIVKGKFIHPATKTMFLRYYPNAVCKNEKKGQYVYNPNKVKK